MRWRYVAYPLILGSAGAFCAFVALTSAGPRQRVNMGLAGDFIPSLLPAVRRDHRFDNVQLIPYTAQDGSLGVTGYVTDEQACADLRRVVLDGRPPVPIAFLVQVFPTDVEPAATRP